MFDEVIAEGALARLAAAVDELLALSVAVASDEFVLGALRAVQSQLNRLAAVDAKVVGEVDARRLCAGRGARDTATLLTQVLRIDPGAARARVAAAQELGPRRALTGEVLAPVFAPVFAALADGSITTGTPRWSPAR